MSAFFVFLCLSYQLTKLWLLSSLQASLLLPKTELPHAFILLRAVFVLVPLQYIRILQLSKTSLLYTTPVKRSPPQAVSLVGCFC